MLSIFFLQFAIRQRLTNTHAKAENYIQHIRIRWLVSRRDQFLGAQCSPRSMIPLYPYQTRSGAPLAAADRGHAYLNPLGLAQLTAHSIWFCPPPITQSLRWKYVAIVRFSKLLFITRLKSKTLPEQKSAVTTPELSYTQYILIVLT